MWGLRSLRAVGHALLSQLASAEHLESAWGYCGARWRRPSLAMPHFPLWLCSARTPVIACAHACSGGAAHTPMGRSCVHAQRTPCGKPLVACVCVVAAPVVDYGAERSAVEDKLAAAVPVVRSYVAKLQKAQRAAEAALDMYAAGRWPIKVGMAAMCNVLARYGRACAAQA